MLRGLGGRQLLHLREEPVRADDVRRGVLADPHMRRARAMHGARRVLMPGRVVGRPLLDVRGGPVRIAVMLRALLVEADMLRARAMYRRRRLRVLRGLGGR
jgi:hypothetical protein